MTTPQWLAKRGGSIEAGTSENTYYVKLKNRPQYRLIPIPVRGRFGCSISQTVNGRSIPSDSLTDSTETAIDAGLEDLRQSLGW